MQTEIKNLKEKLDKLETASKDFHKKIYDTVFEKVKKEKDKHLKEAGSKSCVAVHDYLEEVDKLTKSGRETIPRMQIVADGAVAFQKYLDSTNTEEALREHHRKQELDEALKKVQEVFSKLH